MPKLIIHTGGMKPIEFTFKDYTALNKVELDIAEAIRNYKHQSFVRFHYTDLIGNPRRVILPTKLLVNSAIEFTNNWREPDTKE